jgi:hypothetical protein
MNNIILNLELVPSSSFFNNVRAILTKKQWDILKDNVASKAYNICEICGGVGPKHPVEIHEIWHYDDISLIQKLEGMIALCPNCHSVKHFGLAQMQGRGEKALNHLIKINKISKKEAEEYIIEAFKIWKERSSKTWKLDISILESYGFDVKKIKTQKD